MAIKFVSPENLEYFKTKQDAQNDSEFANKNSVPTSTSQLSNDSGFQTADQVSQAISNAMTSVLTYKGVKPTVADLPEAGNKVGDVWHVSDDGSEWAWNGSEWEELGTGMTVTWDSVQNKPSMFPPSAHTHMMSQITDMPEWSQQPSKPTYTYGEVGAASQNHTHAPFVGATASSAGQSGFVPAPQAAQNQSFLRGDGSWATIPSPETMKPMTTGEIDALFD